MSKFTNTKKTKKFILVLVLLMLFNFSFPKQVKAIDFAGNISSFVFLLERGLIGFLNNLFCDKNHPYQLDSNDGEATVYFTPENIIKGKFILFDANIFREVGSYTQEERYDQFDWLVGQDGAKETLRNTISGWYYNLLNFAIVALLSVLVYVGIRMITSTISQDKAKYKIMFKDWLVAICLLMMMHYIMIGILNITSMVTDAIGTSGGGSNQTANIMSIVYNINSKPNDKWFTEDCDGQRRRNNEKS